MSKVYVVTCGCYSDYSICGVYDDLALATAAIGDSSDADGYGRRIEVFGLNDWLNERERGLKFYRVDMKIDGTVTGVKECGSGEPDHWIGRPPSNPVNAAWFSATAWTDCEQSAIKIANERRIMALAAEQYSSGTPDEKSCS